MHLLLDMNLSPTLCSHFAAAGHEVIHWSSVGDLRAQDAAILSYARDHDMIVVTHDLDFGALLAAGHRPQRHSVPNPRRVGFNVYRSDPDDTHSF
jgi:predicted nuclease of predicted toxin-antitoxin system